MEIIDQIVHYARENKCSDIHLTAKLKPVFRKNGHIMQTNIDLSPQQIKDAILYMMNDEQKDMINNRMEDVDFCYVNPQGQRQRVNVFRQQNELGAVLRILNDEIPCFEDLNLPEAIRKMSEHSNGLVLITGPTGSGKSTTLAAMIDYINVNKKHHIITFEDPIEYLHQHKSCIVHQREVGVDVKSFAAGLKSALREDPDVILVGEMRDLETISAAVTAAETGHLVLSTLHTTGAVNTIDRIIDVFPDEGQDQIRTQLSGVLRGVVTQQLVPTADGKGRVGTFEILVSTDATANLIRENKCHQIGSILQTNAKLGMCTLNGDLARLVREGKIHEEDAMHKSPDKDGLAKLIRGM